jgi:SAM-dependent methyltransferase
MSDESRDPRLAGTERSVVTAQYGDPSHLQSRVDLYGYLQPENPLPVGTRFEDWVLDHLEWSGEECVVDVGCGPGHFLSPIAKRAGRVIGVDLSLGMLAKAREHVLGGRAYVAVADIEQMPVAAGAVDVVLAAFMLYHVPHLDRALDELHRVLRKGGTVLAVTNGPTDKAEIKQVWREAGLRIVGPTFEIPNWLDNFNLDNGRSLLGERFDVVAVDRTTGTFRVPDTGPVMSWVHSFRPGLVDGIDDATWAAVMDELRRTVELEIESHGTFTAGKDSGLLIARSWPA